jgi:putative transposase
LTGEKKVCGRKRHLVVDTLGLIWGLTVTAASVQDWDGACEVIRRAKCAAPRMVRVFADAAYAALEFWAVWFGRVLLCLVRKEPGQRTFVVQPKRWIVERTFGWLNRYRRLSKDYERTTQSSVALVYVAMIHVMIRRLARKT